MSREEHMLERKKENIPFIYIFHLPVGRHLISIYKPATGFRVEVVFLPTVAYWYKETRNKSNNSGTTLFSRFFNLFLCLGVLLASLSVNHMHAEPKEARNRHWLCWKWRCRWSWASTWWMRSKRVLGNGPHAEMISILQTSQMRSHCLRSGEGRSRRASGQSHLGFFSSCLAFYLTQSCFWTVRIRFYLAVPILLRYSWERLKGSKAASYTEDVSAVCRRPHRVWTGSELLGARGWAALKRVTLCCPLCNECPQAAAPRECGNSK